jgi:hypothetical protein
MKTRGPLILAVLVGWFAFGELYVRAEWYRGIYDVLLSYMLILAACAYILGGINVLQVNYPKIRRRDADWQYKIVMLAGALVMGLAGLPWHSLGGERSSGSLAHVPGAAANEAAPGMGRLVIDSERPEALVRIDGGDPLRAWHSGTPEDIAQPPGDQPLAIDLPPGKHTVNVFMAPTGFRAFTQEFEVAAGDRVTVDADLVMLWGARTGEDGRVFTWLYDRVFAPCNATMFALLAFFIASAAFRAFRMRNTESALLLGAAILVMIGLVPIGRAISDWLPWLAEWIVEVPNIAGRRAIMMGAALGAVATGLRIILGIERSYMGSE